MLINRIQEILFENIHTFQIEDEIKQDDFKGFCELAIYFEYVCKSDFTHKLKLKEQFERFLVNQMKKVTENHVFKNLYTAYHLILPYMSIRQFHTIQYLENSLKLIHSKKLFPREAPPHRLLEWDFLLQKMGKIDQVEFPSNNTLLQDLHLQYCDRDLMYAVTHSLFYLTDFGFIKIKKSSICLDKLKFQIECLMVKAWQNRDTDVLLELSINYLNLSCENKINWALFDLIIQCINEAGLFNKKIEFKHRFHSLFVLGIFLSQLKFRLNSNNSLYKQRLKIVLQKIELGITDQQDISIDLNLEPIIKWRIIDSLKSKKINHQLIDYYFQTFGKCSFLSEEIAKHIELLSIRNDLNILWNEEFKILKLNNQIEKTRLKNEYLNDHILEHNF